MKNSAFFVLTALVAMASAANPGLAQTSLPPVSEGIHSLREGDVSICGLTAADVPTIRQMVESQSDAAPLDTGEDFTAVRLDDRIWTFTTAAHSAHPAAVCRFVVTADDGTARLALNMSCENSRENCDALYREFEALNERIMGNAAARTSKFRTNK